MNSKVIYDPIRPALADDLPHQPGKCRACDYYRTLRAQKRAS